jgi:cell division septal protein FtsQ
MKAVSKLLIFTMLFLAMLVVSVTANLNNNRNNHDIIINYPQQSYFNKQLYVENLMQDEYYAGLLKENLYNIIEESISDTPGIQKAELYKLYNGNIIIDLYDREPLAFINLDSKFFIDEESNLIKDDNLKLDLPTLSPNLSEKDINEIVKIILEINKDKYLSGQVDRFWVQDEQIFTSLKSFDFNIKIGSSYNIKDKIKKLKAYCAYYNKELSNLNFNQIDLTYSNQLVAIKN